jgi:hypothetical protein
MNKPYFPSKNYPSYIVKVYNSRTKTVYWLDRSFLNIKNIINSFVHQKYWRNTVYCIYKFPSNSFVELLTYTDNHVRVEIDTPEASNLAGEYIEGWGIVKE